MSELTDVHRSLDDLSIAYDAFEPSPADLGTVEMIVIRPEHDARETPDRADVTPELGLVGDHWSKGEYADRPDMQVTLMNSRVLDLIAGERDHWALAGDNLIVDLDLSPENLPAGQQLAVGSALLEITDTPHQGCTKFSARFGPDALRFVNRGRGHDLRLRGIYARVITPGTVVVGDTVRKA